MEAQLDPPVVSWPVQQDQGRQDSEQQGVQQPEKVGWIRKFCGNGIFRELWRNRYVILRGEHLYISDKEVRDEMKAQEVFDLADYERSDELRKAKSRSKKDLSRFTVLRRRHGNTGKHQVPNLLFLAVSAEEKESWVNALNVAIRRAKNRVLDKVTPEEDGVLAHPTRDRAKIPLGRRLPSRAHLMAAGSPSPHAVPALDLVSEDYSSHLQESWENSCGVVGGRQRAGTDVSKLRATSREPREQTGSLPRGSERCWGRRAHKEAPQTQVLQAHSRTPQPGKRVSVHGRSRCASMDQVLSSRSALTCSELRSALRRRPTEDVAVGGVSVQPLQSLIAQRMQRAQELLEEMRLQELQRDKAERQREDKCPNLRGLQSPRLHHLRGSDSPNSRSSGSPRSSSSPRLRAKDSPRLRGRGSPRSRAKKNSSKGPDSSPSKGTDSSRPQTKESPRLNSGVSLPNRDLDSLQSLKVKVSETPQPHQEVGSPTSPESSPSVKGLDPSKVKGCDSPLSSDMDSLSLSPSKSLHCPQLKPRPSLPLPPFSPTEELEVEGRRAEAERLLEEAVSSWKEAQEVLQEVKELQSRTLHPQHRKSCEERASLTEEDTPPRPDRDL
ncbi:pleckstrin homology domain-containing family O member 1-like [Genypterus blacodes]|uniref:pleckstrin homology domain-containing family O member 1-like n=1 Tax=Genypterus blacodes TaxID=154954 RepID=UPI003F75C140